MLPDVQSTPDAAGLLPVLLLKTRSLPNDAYEEHFADTPSLKPVFIPVLDHKQNESTLGELKELLKNGRLKERYGGMVFTSQRAVEAWVDAVRSVEHELSHALDVDSDLNSSKSRGQAQVQHTATDSRTGAVFETDILTATPFPLYVVGPATERSLTALLDASASSPVSAFSSLRPEIHGAHTGNGATLAPYILSHYNALHQWTWLTWHDAPRLPFIPLLGMGSENYSRRRLEGDDARLRKRPLLFLVGEKRRDIIPRTLRSGDDPVEVDEVEVYSTVVHPGFRHELETVLAHHSETTNSVKIIAVVIFSPQGTAETLQALGLIDQHNNLTSATKTRWKQLPSLPSSRVPLTVSPTVSTTEYIIVTIGPTTRDLVSETFGLEPDVCAATPTPRGVRDGLVAFLRERGLDGSYGFG